jgi:hypothetical protein
MREITLRIKQVQENMMESHFRLSSPLNENGISACYTY